jgi:hypothetical protein
MCAANRMNGLITLTLVVLAAIILVLLLASLMNPESPAHRVVRRWWWWRIPNQRPVPPPHNLGPGVPNPSTNHPFPPWNPPAPNPMSGPHLLGKEGFESYGRF